MLLNCYDYVMGRLGAIHGSRFRISIWGPSSGRDNMRPISLSNFMNKILSRIVHDILESILPRLISSN